MARSLPNHHMESKSENETILFSWKNLLGVDRPQNSSSSSCKEPVAVLPSMVIQICSFGKEVLMNWPVQWAVFNAFFASLSTLMLMRPLRVQSCHLFFLSACDAAYLYWMQKWLGRDKVFENLKEVRLRLVSWEGSKRVISVNHNAIVITVHHYWRYCVMVWGRCCI